MSDFFENLQALKPAQPAARAAQPSEKLRRAAGDFEALLLSSLLEPLASAWAQAPGAAEEKEGDTYAYLAAQAIGRSLSANGGLGIARMLLRNLSLADGHLPLMPEGTGSAKALPESADHPSGRVPDHPLELPK